MADGRVNNSGTKGNKGGNPGYGKANFIIRNVSKYQEEWWTNLGEMLNGDDGQRKFAMQEFNKLQAKMAPQSMDMNVEGDLQIVKISYAKQQQDNSTV